MRRVPHLWLLWVPLLMFVAGVFSNQVVLIANHDKFPVMINSQKLKQYTDRPCRESLLPFKYGVVLNSKISLADISCVEHKDLGADAMIDDVHTVMGGNSRMKALADIWDLNDAIYSVGDFLLMLGGWLLNFTPIVWATLIIRRAMGLE
jgi:hypothetical protein